VEATSKRWVWAGNVARFVESVGAWIHGQTSFDAMARALAVKREWLADILISAGLCDVNYRPTPNTSAQDVLNVVLIFYVTMLLDYIRRLKGVP